MADQDSQGNQGTPDNQDNLADQVNEAFAEAGIDADSVDQQGEGAVAGAQDADAAATSEPADADADANPLEAELAERTEDLQRITAEYANFRRRVDRDRQSDREYAKIKVVQELLPLADDLDRAEQHGDLADGTPLKVFADKFRTTLTSLSVESFGEAGEEFDPVVHEAVQDLSSGDEKSVDAVLRKGYRLGERVVRTAMVVIGDAAEQ